MNYRANERRAKLSLVMPSTADSTEFIKDK